MKVVTVATNLKNFFLQNFLMPSCCFFGLDLVVINPGVIWNSHRFKDNFLKDYLRQVDAEELIFFTDAYDVFFLKEQCQIEKLYHKKQQAIVFSTESSCWPCEDLADIYHGLSSKFCGHYLNSGGIVGTTDAFLKLLNRYSVPPSHLFKDFRQKFIQAKGMAPDFVYMQSNQYFWTLVYLAESENIALDITSEIFLTLGTPNIAGEETIKLISEHVFRYGQKSRFYQQELRRIESSLTCLMEAMPAHVHFNGPIVKAVFRDLYQKGILPKWLKDILSTPKRRHKLTLLTR